MSAERATGAVSWAAAPRESVAPGGKALVNVRAALPAIAARAAELGTASRAPATLKTYRTAWNGFKAWCRAAGHDPLPAAPETVGLYISAVSSGVGALNPRTIEKHVAAIVFHHRLAGHGFDRKHLAVANVLAGLKRTKRVPLRQATPLQPAEIRKLLAVCGDDLAGLRDRAVILWGFNGALRRSELCRVDVEHLVETRDGYRLTIPHSKTDQEGAGEALGIPRHPDPALCPVASLQRWLTLAEIDGGPVFRAVNRWGQVELGRLSERAVSLILKGIAQRAGFARSEIARLSGHSLRAGHITTAYEKDVPEAAIQAQARHKDPRTTRGYRRSATLFKMNSAKGLL